MYRILIVDDDKSVLDVLGKALQEDGYAVATSDDPTAALREFNLQEFQLLLADLRMEPMNGLDLVERCRQQNPRIASIIMTDQPDHQTAVSALRRRINDYIVKPVDVELLETAIALALKGQDSSASANPGPVVALPPSDPSPAKREVLAVVPKVQVYSLGQTRVFISGKEVMGREWRSDKARELFFLLLTKQHRLHREEIIEALWPETVPAKGGSSLNSTAHRMRSALPVARLSHDSKQYWLTFEGDCWYDAQEFGHLVRNAARMPAESSIRLVNLERAVSLYRGPFLKDFYSEWRNEAAAITERSYLHALFQLATTYSANGRDAEVVSTLEGLLALGSYDAGVYSLLIKSYKAMGEISLARQMAQRYHDKVKDEPR